MRKSEQYPQFYYISKGVGFTTQKEGDPVPTVELECYQYEVTKGEDGWLLAQCPELHAVTQAKNMKDLKNNIIEVHSLMIDG